MSASVQARAGQMQTSEWRATRTKAAILLPAVLLAGAAIAACWYFRTQLTDPQGTLTPIVFEAMLAVFLAFLPPLLCMVQTVAKQRQRKRITDLGAFPLGGTASYRTAIATIDSIQDATLGSAYTLPMFVYFVTIFLGATAFMVGYSYPAFFNVPNLLLSGMHDDGVDSILYQRQTFVVIGTAFFASYIYSLGMLLNRINNNDLYPISLHYYAARVVMACIVAAVLRHTFGAFDGATGLTLLLLAGFAVGFAPDLFVLTIIRRGFQVLKIWGVRDDPGIAARPSSMPLLMIDDLTRDKVDRLNELGIDSIAVLARQNPVLLLPRLPYEFAMIVDWIAQAQLYLLVREAGMQAMRAILVRDIFDLRTRLADAAGPAAIAQSLAASATTVAALAGQIDADPTFLRLLEVRTALAAVTPAARIAH